MVEIRESDAGYHVKSESFEHVFSDRSKAVLVAHVVALKQANDLSREVQIVMPEHWGDSIVVEHGAQTRAPTVTRLA